MLLAFDAVITFRSNMHNRAIADQFARALSAKTDTQPAIASGENPLADDKTENECTVTLKQSNKSADVPAQATGKNRQAFAQTQTPTRPSDAALAQSYASGAQDLQTYRGMPAVPADAGETGPDNVLRQRTGGVIAEISEAIAENLKRAAPVGPGAVRYNDTPSSVSSNAADDPSAAASQSAANPIEPSTASMTPAMQAAGGTQNAGDLMTRTAAAVQSASTAAGRAISEPQNASAASVKSPAPGTLLETQDDVASRTLETVDPAQTDAWHTRVSDGKKTGSGSANGSGAPLAASHAQNAAADTPQRTAGSDVRTDKAAGLSEGSATSNKVGFKPSKRDESILTTDMILYCTIGIYVLIPLCIGLIIFFSELKTEAEKLRQLNLAKARVNWPYGT
ncbi:MAG: hypothetical protein LLF76_00185 [Planctomycetaceae bacterium]|nr:hypothetical protein [Planctomycetaceae bacterium]